MARRKNEEKKPEAAEVTERDSHPGDFAAAFGK